MIDRMVIPVNPELPAKFDCTPNAERPASHQQWWFRPYIVTKPAAGRRVTFAVYVLDGGAWDRPTCKAHGLPTLERAVERAEQLVIEYEHSGSQDYWDSPCALMPN